jgi:hypothetical protein
MIGGIFFNAAATALSSAAPFVLNELRAMEGGKELARVTLAVTSRWTLA